MEVAEAGELRGRSRRLTKSRDFDRAYREGQSYATRRMVMYVFRRETDEAGTNDEGGDNVRLGISVNKKIGSAVERSRLKRLLREAFGRVSGRIPAGYDVVLVARPGLTEMAKDGAAGVAWVVDELVEKMRSER